MQISFLCLLSTFTIASVKASDAEVKKLDVRLPVHRPEDCDDKNPENVNVLLATLFEMHHNLLAQISLLEDKLRTSHNLPTIETSEIKHMVEHYTAQKKNIESSIQQIQSNEGLDIMNERNIAKVSSIETKSIPLLVNFFKRNQAPAPETTNANIAYSLPYPQPHFEPQPQQTYVYQPSPSVSNDLIGATFSGFQQQVPQSAVYYQGQPNQQIGQQLGSASQVMIHPQVQGTLSDPQYQLQYQPQAQLQEQIAQQFEQQLQSQINPQLEQQLQSQINPEFEQQLQSQINPQFQQQLQQQQQIQLQQQIQQQQLIQPQLQIQPQQQLQQQILPQLQIQPQQQYEFESVFRPSNVPVRRPQVGDHDTQRYQQQGSFGQKEGIFVYYPNGVITDDKDRPSIANRVGQVFDRFGQVISNLGNWQQSNNRTNENTLRTEGSPALDKTNGSHLKMAFIRLKSKKPIDEETNKQIPEG